MLSSRIEGFTFDQACQQEIYRLISQSLFRHPTTLGTVQAMLLMAGYAENTWFVLGHGLQMALELGLNKALTHTAGTLQSSVSPDQESQRRATRNVRVWLALCFMEREMAIGTARSADRIADGFLSEIRRSEGLVETGLVKLQTARASFEDWLQHWDGLHQGKLFFPPGKYAIRKHRRSLHVETA